MARKRRTPEQAKQEILHAAEAVLLEKGPTALKLATIAKRASISHPLVLHHFGSIEKLLVCLQEKVARQIRNQLLQALQDAPLQDGVAQALVALSSAKHARLMAWLVAQGKSPFPPEKERGLEQIQTILHQRTGRPKKQLGHMILLILFAMYGEGMFGGDLRLRLGIEHSEENKKDFQQWLLSLLQ